jgi:hypothetical protein
VVYRVVGAQLRRHPGAYWEQRDDPELDVVVTHDFIADRWKKTVSVVLAQAGDDVSAERLLNTIVGNWLVDKFRDTDRGSVTRTLGKHLGTHDGFEKVPPGQEGAGRWRLTGTQQQPWSGSLDDLVAAAWSVRARAVRWASDTRRAPIAAAADLSAVLRAVLVAAGGGLTEQQLVEVIVRRFPATLSTPTSPLTALDETAERVADTQPLPEEDWQARQGIAESAEAGAVVMRQLIEQDRYLLRLLAAYPKAQVVRRVQEDLGCGRSRAYQHVDRVRGLVRELAGAFDDDEQVVRDVLVLCQAEIGAVDDGGDEPSNSSENPVIAAREAS